MLVAAAGLVLAASPAPVPTLPTPPKLVVMLVVDQMRSDYVDRFQDRWTRGLRRLVDEGAWFRLAEYPYFTTVTCAGHATIGTGALPSVHGMIANTWWDRVQKKEVACADDPATSIISYGAPLEGTSESARALRTSTLADELRAQLDPASRTVVLSLKARSVVTMAGQRADAAVWFDDRGQWVTSNAYSAGPVPEVARFVKAHPIVADMGTVWDRLLPRERYWFASPALGAAPKDGMTPAFPHRIGAEGGEPDAAFFGQWQSSPLADAYLAHMALDLVESLRLGTRRTDLLGISFSTLDKVGHDFGPESHEIQDVLSRLDVTLGDLFDGLDRVVGRGQYVVALSADHGVAPIPESARMQQLDSGRLSAATIDAAVEEALAPLGPGQHVAKSLYGQIYLAPRSWTAVRRSPSLQAAIRARLLRVPGVQAVYSRDELMASSSGEDDLRQRLARSLDADRSGDIVAVLRPYWLWQTSGTSHGTAYGYDVRVPVFLMGHGIRPGEYTTPASPADIAPTLAALTGVTLPRAQGRVLAEALAVEKSAPATPVR